MPAPAIPIQRPVLGRVVAEALPFDGVRLYGRLMLYGLKLKVPCAPVTWPDGSRWKVKVRSMPLDSIENKRSSCDDVGRAGGGADYASHKRFPQSHPTGPQWCYGTDPWRCD